MSRIFSATVLLLALGLTAQSASVPRRHLAARHLLGSSFGVPGNQSFDYVVVGGGNGGLAIAARLAEDPSRSVAIVEAGGFYEIDNGNRSEIPANDIYWSGKDPKDTNPLIDWGFVTTPQAGALNASIHYARGKCLGGSTARNYMAYHRATEDSYKMWAQMVGDHSYTFDSLLPFFEKSLDFTPPDTSKRAANATPEYDLASFGKGGGPLSVTFSNYAQAFSSWVQKGLQEIGIAPIKGFTSGKLNGSSYVLETIQPSTQVRESSETAFLRPALNRTNLMVYQATMGKKVLFNQDKTAVGVQVDTDGILYTLSAKKEVILSAGAFQSPQLLMVSGVGPAASLQKHNIPVVADRPGVGQNMWDHILMGPSYRVNVITGSALANPEFALEASQSFNDNQSGILTNSGGDFLAREKIPQSLRSSFSNKTLTDLSAFPQDWPEIEFLSMGGYLGYQQNYIRDGPTDGYNYATVSAALVAPLSRGTVDISSADAADPPVIDPKWLTHPTDQAVAVAVAGYKRVRQLFNTTAMQPVLIGGEAFPGTDTVHTDDQILDIIKKSFSTVYHASSTCSMGKKGDRNAVVDSKARVFGVKGLRVVDASAFPFLPPGHPVATVYALAEKIASDIKGEK